MADLPVSFPLGVAWGALKAARRFWWLFRRTWNGAWRTGLRVSVAGIESGPTTHSLGFTEPALRVILSNGGKGAVRVTDLRLMFSGPFGLPVLPEAPAGRSHPTLPARIATAEELVWYFPAQVTSRTLNALFMPSRRTGHDVVTVYVRCRFSSGMVCVSRLVRFPTRSLVSLSASPVNIKAGAGLRSRKLGHEPTGPDPSSVPRPVALLDRYRRRIANCRTRRGPRLRFPSAVLRGTTRGLALP